MRTSPRGVPSLVIALVLVSGLGAVAQEEAKNLADVPALLKAHNRERAAENLDPLTANPKLEAAALAHARDMAIHDKMTHEGSDGSTPKQRIELQGYHGLGLAENVAYGAKRVPEVMRLWMESPPHKKNILGDFTEVGFALVKGEDGTPFWSAEFGKPMPRLDPEKAAADVVRLFDQERKQVAKPPLKNEPRLATVAQRHARTMAEHSEFRAKLDDDLTPFDLVEKAGYRYKRIGQASLQGPPTAAEAAQAWLDEPSNRESLMGDVRDVGVGYALSEKGIPFWSLIFAEPRR
ncbi:CAP domain-containing protein [Singulisphaera sp. Ch08]|uniref:CAP domain-containing protein n=1 Tax=Singulisphaera sp. Ch08 TaxID=3120278 RepID=A0AAU7CMT2_9BACT